MLQFRPRNIFSWSFDVERTVQGFSEHVASLTHSLWRERGTIEMPEQILSIRREGIVHARFVVQEDERELLTVGKPSMMRRRYMIRRDANTWMLEPVSAIKRGFELRLNGRPVGRIEPESAFTRRGSADFPPDVPLELQLICVWLVILSWKRSAAAASGSG